MTESISADADEAFHRRFHPRARFRRAISCHIVIEAPRDEVWTRLIGFCGYADWNAFTTEIRGDLAVGQAVEITVSMLKRRPFVQREWINLLRAPEVICWGTHLGLPFLLTTNRWQTLEPGEGDVTTYRNELQLSGLLAPLVMLLYGSALARAFSTAARGLKAACES
jgi:hypothetical protein